jgi:hypothetical protein
MKMADVLRDIADLIDQKMGQSDPQAADDQGNQNRLEPVEVDKSNGEDQPKMVPPLQAKLEILKKSEGMPNVYDEQGDAGNDELAMIKKNAGLTAAQQEASEDNDITG